MSEIIIDPNATTSQLVGVVPESIIKYFSIKCHSYEVHMPPGVLKHLRKRGHWVDFLTHYKDIPTMISCPDYAGQNPKEPNSIELYKVMGDYILIAIKLNPSSGLFMGSFYKLDDGFNKVQRQSSTTAENRAYLSVFIFHISDI